MIAQMKKLIAGTIILLVAAIAISVIYFKNLDAPAGSTTQVLRTIPNTAALIFEFSNDAGFYDMFNGNKTFEALIGADKLNELKTLRDKLLLNYELKKYFNQQHVYISMHGLKTDETGLLITLAAGEGFTQEIMNDLAKQYKNGLKIAGIDLAGKKVMRINVDGIKAPFYLVNRGDHIYSGTFSKQLAAQCAAYMPLKNKRNFMLIPDRQNSNSLANLYVNYEQLTPLFDQWFKNNNVRLFRAFRSLPALEDLTLHSPRAALMFHK